MDGFGYTIPEVIEALSELRAEQLNTLIMAPYQYHATMMIRKLYAYYKGKVLFPYKRAHKKAFISADRKHGKVK